jgi:hypothetical protein
MPTRNTHSSSAGGLPSGSPLVAEVMPIDCDIAGPLASIDVAARRTTASFSKRMVTEATAAPQSSSPP